MKIKGVRLLFHYIDDFITIGAPKSEECAHNVAIMNTVCDETGIPIEPEKTEGPATSITFLGIEIDTVALEIRLPRDKLSVLKSTLQTWRGRKKSLQKAGVTVTDWNIVSCQQNSQSRQDILAQTHRPFHSGQTLGPFCATELECQGRFRMVVLL